MSEENFGNKLGSFLKAVQKGYKGLLAITGDEVYGKLENLEVKKAQYTDEKKVEKVIFEQLDILYKDKVHRQYNIQGFLGLKCDLDIGDGQVGIELKLANQLSSSTTIERLLGQVLYYSKRTYKENLIVIVVGYEKEFDQRLRELKSIIEEQNVKFFYLNVK